MVTSFDFGFASLFNGISTLVSGGARGVMVIFEGNGDGDTSSNPGPG